MRAYNCTTEWTESSSFGKVTGLPCTYTGNATNVNSLGMKFWNLTGYIKGMFDSGMQNITIRLNSSDLKNANALLDTSTLRGGLTLPSSGAKSYADFNSKEAGVFTPILNITYRG